MNALFKAVRPRSKTGPGGSPERLPHWRQRTLAREVRCTGTGLHSGVPVELTIRPAPAGHGLVIRRTHRESGSTDIPVRWDLAVESPLCTTVGREPDARVGTVEHLLSALAGLGIDNAVLEVDGPEIPIMDGSAAPFIFLADCAGVRTLEAPRRMIEVVKPVTVEDGGRTARLEPCVAGFHLDVEIDFDSAAIGHQTYAFSLNEGGYRDEVARARTFGFLDEVHALRRAGLCLGGSLDNAVVVDGDRIVNDGGLRFADEFVRHKLLDCIGDLALAGAPLQARFSSSRPGHALNLKLLAALFADSANWKWRAAQPAGGDEAPGTDIHAAYA